ncbi:MAG: acyltransferase [Clostridia bacterium]|nr:acyltransferase [Clostridia bacterium]
MAEKKERQSNFELLRIIAMLMIITLHATIDEKGGFLSELPKFALSSIAINSLRTLSYCCTNLYVLISGYFLVNAKFRFKKILTLWMTVIFYSLFLYAVSVLIGWNDFSFGQLLLNCLPIITRKYWFASTYLLLMLVFPILNKAILSMTKGELKAAIIALTFLFCVWDRLPFTEIMLDVYGGSSLVWFVTLYFYAAYYRLYGFPKMRKFVLLLLYFLSALTMLATYYFYPVQLSGNPAQLLKLFAQAYSYNSPFVLIMSLSLFIIFAKTEIRSAFINNLILSISPLTFGVYLIHENDSIIKYWSEILQTQKYRTSGFAVLYMIFCVIVIFAVCSIIELIRRKTVGRIEKSKLIVNFSNKVESLFIKLFKLS